MSKSCVAILSDSSRLCSALEQAMKPHFSNVVYVADVKEVSFDEDLPRPVLVVDATYPQKTLEDLRALSKSARPENAVILLRGKQDGTEFLEIAVHAGAILPDSCTIEEIVLTTRLVREGLTILPSELLQQLLQSEDDPEGDLAKLGLLTDRESGVLAMICQGSGNKTIARRLDISDSTVRVHVRSILRKLGLQNRTQAALIAHRHIEKLLNQAG